MALPETLAAGQGVGVVVNSTVELVAGRRTLGHGWCGRGYLQPSVTYSPRRIEQGREAGVNRPLGNANGTSTGFDGEGGKYLRMHLQPELAARPSVDRAPPAGRPGGDSPTPADNGTIKATAAPGHPGAGPASSSGAGMGGMGGGAGSACFVDDSNSTP